MTVVVDYGRGNLFSIGQALRHCGADYRISADPAEIADADRLILPGVGAFGDAMDSLRRLGLDEPIVARARAGVPLLGICLGMQMLADSSEEFGEHAGLGLIPGRVSRLADAGDPGMRVPNVGWRRLMPVDGNAYMAGFAAGDMVYFVHSYVPVPGNSAHLAALIDFDTTPVAAVIRRDNIVGYQFHPEKSGDVGLGLIRRFLEMAPGAAA